MCMCCVTEAIEYDLFSNIGLVKATKGTTTCVRSSKREITITPGMLGLVISNDPFVWFDNMPMEPEPPLDEEDASNNDLDAWFAWAQAMDDWADNLDIDPMDAHVLVQAMLDAGFDENKETWSVFLQRKITSALAGGPRPEQFGVPNEN